MLKTSVTPKIDLAGIMFMSITELKIWIESKQLDGQAKMEFTGTGTKQNTLYNLLTSLCL